MSQKVAKPTLTGQRIKTRKRGKLHCHWLCFFEDLGRSGQFQVVFIVSVMNVSRFLIVPERELWNFRSHWVSVKCVCCVCV